MPKGTSLSTSLARKKNTEKKNKKCPISAAVLSEHPAGVGVDVDLLHLGGPGDDDTPAHHGLVILVEGLGHRRELVDGLETAEQLGLEAVQVEVGPLGLGLVLLAGAALLFAGPLLLVLGPLGAVGRGDDAPAVPGRHLGRDAGYEGGHEVLGRGCRRGRAAGLLGRQEDRDLVALAQVVLLDELVDADELVVLLFGRGRGCGRRVDVGYGAGGLEEGQSGQGGRDAVALLRWRLVLLFRGGGEGQEVLEVGDDVEAAVAGGAAVVGLLVVGVGRLDLVPGDQEGLLADEDRGLRSV